MSRTYSNHREEQRPERINAFRPAAAEYIRTSFSQYHTFLCENLKSSGKVPFVNYCDNEEAPHMILFKDS